MWEAIWEFMRNYAESFWKSGEYAYNIFSVIMAWAITIGFAFWLCAFIAAIGTILGEKIKESTKGGNPEDNPTEEEIKEFE